MPRSRRHFLLYVLLPLTFVLLFAVLYRNGRQKVSVVSGSATVPASAANWGLSFPNEGGTPVGNATQEELSRYDAHFLGDTGKRVLYLTFDC
ncbi:MAG: hypothetical protein IJT31_02605, partial [Oscillibacter sp.]|nr:hypothetical protein [Oscillibacter sp.]